MKNCMKCGTQFKNHVFINGKSRNLHRRKYCLTCSPFGLRNTKSLIRNAKPKAKSNYEHVKDWRRRIKVRSIIAMGGSCCCCGYSRCIKALEFHHLNIDDKEFSIGHSIKTWESIVKELKKCVLVCCRCHREIHDGIIIIPINAPKFDDKYTTCEKYTCEKLKIDIAYEPCPVCGKSKALPRKTCSMKCSNVARQKIDWSTVDLIKMVQIESPEFIGRKLGVSGATVRCRLKALGVCPPYN